MLKYSDEEVSAIVRRVKSGDTEAFAELVEIYQKFVFGTVLSDLKNTQDAEDVAQEVFIKAWRGIGSFRGDSSFGTWLYTITKNTVKDFIKKRERSPQTVGNEEMLEDKASSEPTPEESVIDREAVDDIMDYISSLPEEQRDAVTYRDLMGITYLEIADITGVTVGTVKSRISRAREALKKHIESAFNGGNGTNH